MRKGEKKLGDCYSSSFFPHSPNCSLKQESDSCGTRRIFDLLKNLTGHFIHKGPFNIFALLTLGV